MFRRQVKILFLVLALLLIPMHQAKAIDPVTIAILAPVVLQLANAARPYIIRGLTNLGKGVLRVAKGTQGSIRALNVGFYHFVFLQFLKGHNSYLLHKNVFSSAYGKLRKIARKQFVKSAKKKQKTALGGWA